MEKCPEKGLTVLVTGNMKGELQLEKFLVIGICFRLPQVAGVEPTFQTCFVFQDSATVMEIGLFLTYSFPNCIKALLNALTA